MFQGQPGLIKPPIKVDEKEGDGVGEDGSGGGGSGDKRKRRKRRKKYDFSDDLAARQEEDKRLAQEVCPLFNLQQRMISVFYVLFSSTFYPIFYFLSPPPQRIHLLHPWEWESFDVIRRSDFKSTISRYHNTTCGMS